MPLEVDLTGCCRECYMPLHGGICEYDPEHTPLPEDLDDPALAEWFPTWLQVYQRRSTWSCRFDTFGPLPRIPPKDLGSPRIWGSGSCSLPMLLLEPTRRARGGGLWDGRPACPTCLMPLSAAGRCPLDAEHDCPRQSAGAPLPHLGACTLAEPAPVVRSASPDLQPPPREPSQPEAASACQGAGPGPLAPMRSPGAGRAPAPPPPAAPAASAAVFQAQPTSSEAGADPEPPPRRLPQAAPAPSPAPPPAPAASAADLQALPTSIEAWLWEVEPAGFLAQYRDTIAAHFDSPAQVVDVYLRPAEGGRPAVMDPRFFEAMGVQKLGHRRLFDKWASQWGSA